MWRCGRLVLESVEVGWRRRLLLENWALHPKYAGVAAARLKWLGLREGDSPDPRFPRQELSRTAAEEDFVPETGN